MTETHVDRAPAAVAYVSGLLDGLRAPWVLGGGWAADTWLGRQTRDHYDVDILMFHQDQRTVFEHLDGWALVGHDPNVPDDTPEPWDGRWLDLPAHIHVPMLGTVLATQPEVKHTAFEFEFLLNARTGPDWVLNPDLDVSVPVEDAVRISRYGIPTAAPEIVLFYKAGGAQGNTNDGSFRQRDEDDFFALLPLLDEARRHWLADSIQRIRAEHPWLVHLR